MSPPAGVEPLPRDEPLAIRLDRDGDVPLGVQLAWALRMRIESGALAPGARLPGLQRLAAAVGVNANTVRAVYARLEQDGLVTTRHGSGTFATGAGAGRRAVVHLAADASRAARGAGVDPREVAAALYAGSNVAPPPDATDAGAAAAERRLLRAQIAALEKALSELTARRATSAVEPAELLPAGPVAGRGPRLPSALALARQRDELLDRLVAVLAR